MAEKHAPPASDDCNSNTPNKQRPTPIDLRDCSANFQESSKNRASLSPAERYITGQADMFGLNSSAPPENASTVSSTTSGALSQNLDKWRENECNKIHKKEPHRYKYGSPPPATNPPTFQRFNSLSADDNKRSDNPVSAVFRRLRK